MPLPPPNFRALSRETGIPHQTLYSRYHDEGARGDQLTRPIKTPMLVHGRTYREWCELIAKAYGGELQPEDLAKRVRDRRNYYGCSNDDALKIVLEKMHRRYVRIGAV